MKKQEFPRNLIDLSCIDKIDVSGRGGKEHVICDLLPRWGRADNGRLHDYETSHNGRTIRLEIKKQQNENWFDSGKYYRLSTVDREIFVMFVMFRKPAITTQILVAELGELIDWLCKNQPERGWCDEVLKTAADYKIRFPSLQFKSSVKVLKVFKEAPQLFEVLYQRD